jgi:hypothetical protein
MMWIRRYRGQIARRVVGRSIIAKTTLAMKITTMAMSISAIIMPSASEFLEDILISFAV